MPEKRTDPTTHCYRRPLNGGYVTAAATTPEHLRAVFDAERARLAAKERRPRRKARSIAGAPTQLQLVA